MEKLEYTKNYIYENLIIGGDEWNNLNNLKEVICFLKSKNRLLLKSLIFRLIDARVIDIKEANELLKEF